MKSDFILCSVDEDLVDIDKANLRMNGIMVTNDLSEALQPMLENETNTLLITDKVIEEQSSMQDIVKSVSILYEIYPKNIRIIYVKMGGEHDPLIKLMDVNSNWDVYYNEELNKTLTEDIVDKFLDRKLPIKNNRKQLDTNLKNVMLRKANSLVNELILSIKENKDVDNNNRFKSVVIRNMSLIKNLAFAYNTLKEDLSIKHNEIKDLNITIDKLNEDLKDERYKYGVLNKTLTNLEDNRKVMHSNLRELQSKHNVLVDRLHEVINIGEVHTTLSKTIDADRYLGKAPIIVYFKEYTKLNYFTTFITKFNTLLTNTFGLSRVLVVENDSSTGIVPLYEEKDYVYVTDGTEMERVVLGNLVTCGSNPKLMNYLIQNSLKLDVLIVYDRTGYHEDLIEGSNVIKFNLLRNLEDKETLNIKGKNIVTNDPKGNYYVGRIKEYEEIKGNEDLELSIVSSLDITKKLITYVSDWNSISVVDSNDTEDKVEEVILSE